MQEWQFLTALRSRESHNMQEAKGASEPDSDLPVPDFDWLNAMANEGWELMMVIESALRSQYHFKRPAA